MVVSNFYEFVEDKEGLNFLGSLHIKSSILGRESYFVKIHFEEEWKLPTGSTDRTLMLNHPDQPFLDI